MRGAGGGAPGGYARRGPLDHSTARSLDRSISRAGSGEWRGRGRGSLGSTRSLPWRVADRGSRIADRKSQSAQREVAGGCDDCRSDPRFRPRSSERSIDLDEDEDEGDDRDWSRAE
ncbi:uncharacterized protein LOC143917074 [Arctopsyche grandis]|uniref:uncharacterized protein LOC143917074 n=1 Tax=Arctopsyche grandis TaxID=121162 RepID=UPI00406D857D